MKIKVSDFLDFAQAIFSGDIVRAAKIINYSPCNSCIYRDINTKSCKECQGCEVLFSNWLSRKDTN